MDEICDAVTTEVEPGKKLDATFDTGIPGASFAESERERSRDLDKSSPALATRCCLGCYHRSTPTLRNLVAVARSTVEVKSVVETPEESSAMVRYERHIEAIVT